MEQTRGGARQYIIIVTLAAVLACIILSRPIVSAPDTKYMMARSEYAKVYYTSADEEYVRLICAMTDLYLPLLLADFGREDAPAVIIIRADKSFTNGVDGIPNGAYANGVINILSPRLWLPDAESSAAKDYFIKNGPLIHELAHHAASETGISGGERWLAEGVALYYEYKYTGREWRPDLSDLARRITLADLRERFGEIDERAAYRKAFEVVRGYAERLGERTLQAVLNQSSLK